MNITMKDFCTWAGSQAGAAKLLGVSEAKVSRLVNGRQPVTPDIAVQVEIVSEGKFPRDRVLWPEAEGVNRAA